jgi:hypothetical protein
VVCSSLVSSSLFGSVMDMIVPGLIYERSTKLLTWFMQWLVPLMFCRSSPMLYLARWVWMVQTRRHATATSMRFQQEHHEYCNDDVKSGKIPAQRSPSGAQQPSTAPTARFTERRHTPRGYYECHVSSK